MAGQTGYKSLGLTIFSLCFLWSDNISLIFPLGIFGNSLLKKQVVQYMVTELAKHSAAVWRDIHHLPPLFPYPLHVQCLITLKGI